MIEIKVEMSEPTPAVEAKPAMPTGFSVSVDRYDIRWGKTGRGVYCYTPNWATEDVTSDDIRKFAAMMTEIADALDEQNAQQETANG